MYTLQPQKQQQQQPQQQQQQKQQQNQQLDSYGAAQAPLADQLYAPPPQAQSPQQSYGPPPQDPTTIPPRAPPRRRPRRKRRRKRPQAAPLPPPPQAPPKPSYGYGAPPPRAPPKPFRPPLASDPGLGLPSIENLSEWIKLKCFIWCLFSHAEFDGPVIKEVEVDYGDYDY